MNVKGSPKITDMKVIPVAGYDSMIMSRAGAHAPFFTRVLVVLTDSSGNVGIGEVHGSTLIHKTIESYIPLVIGREIGDYKNIVLKLSRSEGPELDGEMFEASLGSVLAKGAYKSVVQAESAVECALLDLLGKYLNLPVCSLLGDGKQRDEVVALGYLFYGMDKDKTDLPYLDEGNGDSWFAIRRKPFTTPEDIVRQARAVNEMYGVKDFKLKGGVFSGEDEMQAIRALKKEFPDARVNIDPNGAWSLKEAIELCRGMKDILTYAEDPCGEEGDYSGREIMSEFKMATGIPVATNMIVTNWRHLRHAVDSKAVDVVLADPHFWNMSGSVRCGQMLNDFGMTWGCHSNSHFDISLAIFAHTAAACPGEITAIDTHWIWQDGQDLCNNAYKIKGGKIKIPDAPGLGLEINMDRVWKAHELYNKLDSHDRDDSVAMQYLIPGWKFDPKRPCMVR